MAQNLAQIPTRERIPAYLRRYVIEQDYGAYSPRDHATWRFIMRCAREHLGTYAHAVYCDGLKATGIFRVLTGVVLQINGIKIKTRFHH